MQQILFFKELEFTLKEIQLILSQPDFQILPSLKKHQQVILDRISRYRKLLHTVQATILDLQGDQKMSPDEMFNGFDEREYQSEARRLWGETAHYKESQKNWSSYSKEQKRDIIERGGEITRRLVTENPQAKPDDPGVQAAVSEYYQYLNEYFYSCEVEFLRGLADMWVEDPRFAVNYERIREGGAEFVRQAVHLFCDRNG